MKTSLDPPSPMQLVPAIAADAPRLVDILFTAFVNDGLIVGACYPDTPANRAWWVRSITAQMASSQSIVYKAIADDDSIVAWAKWQVQRSATDTQAEGAVNPSNEPSPDMNLEACQKLSRAQYTMREQVMKGRDHYCISFKPAPASPTRSQLTWLGLNALATDPAYQRQGAATALVAQGTSMADAEGLASFSACSTQANFNMQGVFRKAGFSIVAQEPVANGFSVHAGFRAPAQAQA